MEKENRIKGRAEGGLSRLQPERLPLGPFGNKENMES
jgi:hypothetical protein